MIAGLFANFALEPFVLSCFLLQVKDALNEVRVRIFLTFDSH